MKEYIEQDFDDQFGNRKRLQDIEGLETQFKQWCDNEGLATSTYNRYWDKIRGLPVINLFDDSLKILKYHFKDVAKQSSVQSPWIKFLDFLDDQYEIYIDEEVDSETKQIELYDQMTSKIDEFQQFIRDRNTDNGKKEAFEEKIEDNYIPTSDLIKLLEKAEPERARFWWVLYETGARISGIKRNKPELMNLENGEHGELKIKQSRSKSKETRDIKFKSPVTPQILQEAPTGNWEDKDGIEWKGVFYPDRYNDQENYWIRKFGGEIGLLDRDAGETRSVHSFRHTRVTHLIKDKQVEEDKEDVQERSGHQSLVTTEQYNKVSIPDQGQTVENYCEKHDIDLKKVINNEPT